MTERLILIETTRGVCDGPRHIPAATRASNGRTQNFQERVEANHGVPPQRWVAECGALGMIFVDAPLLADRPECFGCRVTVTRRPVESWRRYDNDADRLEARRRTWRESKRRRRVA